MKKILSILLVAMMVLFTGAFMASADTFTDIDIVPNKLIEFSIASGNSYEDTFKPAYGKGGEYTFISFGDACPTVTVSYDEQGYFGKKTITETIESDNGMLFGTYDFTAGTEYTITVKGDGKFSVIFFKPDANKCGFVTEPDKKSYYDGLEVSISGSNVTFLNDCLDLTGASFALVDSDGKTVYTVKDNALKKIIKSATYEKNTIKLAVNSSKKFLGITYKEYSAISLDVKTYPIKSVVLNHDELHYTYGDKDGKITGTLGSHYFTPDIKFNEMTANVTLIDDTKFENVEIKEENGRYYFELENIGKVYITNESQCPESGTVDADIVVGATPYKLTVNIDKAGFFQKLAIFFRLVFGAYKK